MNALLTALREMKTAIRFLLAMQRVTVETSAPLTVRLQDGTILPAIAVTGLAYPADTPAVAVMSERSQPLVFPIGA